MKKILIIEDDENLNRGIAFSFEKDGYHVIRTATLEAGRKAFAEEQPDLILLDVALPDGSGMDFCSAIRMQSQIPIIMLTARDLETDEVAGLLSGADDYITKPFSLSILRARVDAIFRRLEQTNSLMMQSGKFRLDLSRHQLYFGETEIFLSTTEFKLTAYFIRNVGQILTKEQILDALWDQQGVFVDENTLAVNISRLRSKLEQAGCMEPVIQTVHGIGYLWKQGKSNE